MKALLGPLKQLFKAFRCSFESAGGLDEDFGIKFNCENGGPAPEKVTNLIFETTKSISEYKICKGFPEIDISKSGSYLVENKVRVDVFDCTEDHIGMLMKVFDFPAIKKLIARKDFSPFDTIFSAFPIKNGRLGMVYDSMNGVQGPYARRVFVDELGAPERLNLIALQSFSMP